MMMEKDEDFSEGNISVTYYVELIEVYSHWMWYCCMVDILVFWFLVAAVALLVLLLVVSKHNN